MRRPLSAILAVLVAGGIAPVGCATSPGAPGEGLAAKTSQPRASAPLAGLSAARPEASAAHSTASTPPAVASTAAPTAPAPVASAAPAPAIPDAGKVAVDLVSRMPEVKRYCASLERAAQPSHCTMWPEEPAAPGTTCAANASYTDDCLWPVYLGESQPDHSVRFATLYVNPTTRAVVAASDFMCGLMPIAAWRKWLGKRAAAPADKPPECP